MYFADTKGEYFITTSYPKSHGKTIFNKRINTTDDAVILMDFIYMKKKKTGKINGWLCSGLHKNLN